MEALLRATTDGTVGRPAAPLDGEWSLVRDITQVWAEMETGVVREVSLAEVKAALQSGARNFVALALGRRNDTVLWGYLTRRYAQCCAEWESHQCDQQFSLTVREFLPAVLNAANLHDIDSVLTLKIALERYFEFSQYLALMFLAEHACGMLSTSVEVLADMMRATAVQLLETFSYTPLDLAPPFSDFVVPAQLADALRPINMSADVAQAFLMTEEILPDDILPDDILPSNPSNPSDHSDPSGIPEDIPEDAGLGGNLPDFVPMSPLSSLMTSLTSLGHENLRSSEPQELNLTALFTATTPVMPVEPEGEMAVEPEGEMAVRPESEMAVQPESEMPAHSEGEMPAQPEGEMAGAELQFAAVKTRRKWFCKWR